MAKKATKKRESAARRELSERVEEAVQYLLAADKPMSLVRELARIIKDWPRQPVKLVGEKAVLNPLIFVGVNLGRDVFDELIEAAKADEQWPAKTHKVTYQVKEFMPRYRERMKLAIERHELTHGKIKRENRAEFEKNQRARWTEAKKKFLVQRGALKKGNHEATREFWRLVETNLRADIERLRQRKIEKSAR